jgi:hypothetical protein
MRRREVEEVGGHGTESEDEVTRAQEVRALTHPMSDGLGSLFVRPVKRNAA